MFRFLPRGLLLGLYFTGVHAHSLPNVESIQLTHCLADKMTSQYQTLAQNDQYKIIQIPSAELENLIHAADSSHCGRFINVTPLLARDTKNIKSSANALLNQTVHPPAIKRANYNIEHQDVIRPLVSQIEPNNIWQTLSTLTHFYNRSASSQTGEQTASWLKEHFDQLALASGRQDVDSWFVETGYYRQPSLVTVIGKDIQAPAVVVGAHMDTLDKRMPGAGDDGSGSSSVMEAARVILNSGAELKRPIYIIWYAAEERGLVGSGYVVRHFQQHRIPVYAAVQFDMTGFRNEASDETMWLFKDYTDSKLTAFNAELIKAYIGVPVSYSYCGYGCSDHASWTAAGVPAAFPCETSFERHNPAIHTSRDTKDRLNLNHMTNFSKLAVAFAMELALS